MNSPPARADFKPGFPISFLHGDHVRGLIFDDTVARLDNYTATA